jgi:chemotaxis protein MotB
LPDDRVLRVQGLAASTPYDRKDPGAPANRRISIIVMNREAEDRVFRSAIETPEPAQPPRIEGGPNSSLPRPVR